MSYKIKERTNFEFDLPIHSFLENNLPYQFTKGFFEWQYNRRDSIFYYIEEESNALVVGVNGLIPYALTDNTTTYKTAKSETSYISSNHQGKGLFKKLYEELIFKSKENKFEFIWGFTKLGDVWKKLGFKVADGYLCEATIILNPSFNLQRKKFTDENLIKIWVRFLYNNLRKFYLKLYINFHFKNKEEIVLKYDDIDFYEIDVFNKKVKEKNPTMIFFEFNKKNVVEILNTNPHLNYRFISFYSKGNMVGYIIYTNKNYSLNITDIQFLENSDLELMLYSFLFDNHKEIYDVTFLGNYQNEKIKLIFNLFKRLKSKNVFSEMKIVYKANFEYSNSNFFNLNNWYINSFWTESINR